MNISLINNGGPAHINTRRVIKKFIPEIANNSKNLAALLLPRKLLRSLLSGFETEEKRFPLGLGYLSAMLKRHGHTVYLLDRFADLDEK